MAGRYGADELNFFLVMLGMFINVFAMLFRNGIVSILAAVPLGLFLYRTLSKNITARREENNKYLAWRNKVSYTLKNFRTVIAFHKAHKYFKCPACGQKLRVPRGVGKVNIKCPKCGGQFEGKA